MDDGQDNHQLIQNDFNEIVSPSEPPASSIEAVQQWMQSAEPQQQVYSDLLYRSPPPSYDNHEPAKALSSSVVELQPQTGGPSIEILSSLRDLDQDGRDFLRYLSTTSKLKFIQKIDICCLITKCNDAVEFSILDEGGNLLFYGVETSECIIRQCFGRQRPLVMILKDRTGKHMMKVERSMDCSCCCGLLCPDKFNVHLPNYEFLGSIKQQFSCTPSYTISNALIQPIMRVYGPLFNCTIAQGQKVEYRILDLQDRELGKIYKNWSSFGQEFYSHYDNFDIEFPAEASPQEKALCLATVFTINVRHYEKTGLTPMCKFFYHVILPVFALIVILNLVAFSHRMRPNDEFDPQD